MVECIWRSQYDVTFEMELLCRGDSFCKIHLLAKFSWLSIFLFFQLWATAVTYWVQKQVNSGPVSGFEIGWKSGVWSGSKAMIISAPCIFVRKMIFNFFFCSYKLLNRCLPSLIIYTCSWCIPDWNIIPHNSQISRNWPIKKIWTSANSIYHHCNRDICHRDLKIGK